MRNKQNQPGQLTLFPVLEKLDIVVKKVVDLRFDFESPTSFQLVFLHARLTPTFQDWVSPLQCKFVANFHTVNDAAEYCFQNKTPWLVYYVVAQDRSVVFCPF